MFSKGKLVLIVRPEQSDSQNPHEKPIKDQFTLPGKWGTSPEPGLGRELKGERLVAGPKAIGPSGYAQLTTRGPPSCGFSFSDRMRSSGI